MFEKKPLDLRSLSLVYLSLLLLLALTVIASSYPLGVWSWPVGVGIAGGKAVLVALFFMNLKNESPALRLVAMAGLLWLGLLLTFTFSDYLTRFSFGVLGK